MSDNGSRSRRDLLTGWMDMFRGVSTAATGTTKHDPEKLLRPPGALKPDEDFVSACTGCGDCIPVCPTSSIFTVELEDERQIPVIAPSTKACYLCTELPCIAACEEGALVDPGGPEKVRMGIARVDPRRCVTFRGEHRCHRRAQSGARSSNPTRRVPGRLTAARIQDAGFRMQGSGCRVQDAGFRMQVPPNPPRASISRLG